MGSLAVAFPILPGKVEVGRRFATELLGPRQRELADYCQRIGLTRELWFIQESPQGSMVLVYLEGPDPARSMKEWSASDHPFDQWWKQTAGAICGVDFNQPPPALPEQILEWPPA